MLTQKLATKSGVSQKKHAYEFADAKNLHWDRILSKKMAIRLR